MAIQQVIIYAYLKSKRNWEVNWADTSKTIIYYLQSTLNLFPKFFSNIHTVLISLILNSNGTFLRRLSGL